MKIYCDDDSQERRLVAQLRKAGHPVTTPTDAGRAGVANARHMVFALEHGLFLLSRNYRDFADLHDVILAAKGEHPGILLIRSDNDRLRDMRPGEIVAAVSKLEKSGLTSRNQLIHLNQWR